MKPAVAALTIGIALTVAACGETTPWAEKAQSKGACNVEVKGLLRDPGSFEAIKHISNVDKADPGKGSILVEFRSKNGFGGYQNGIAMCTPKEGGGPYDVRAQLLTE